MQFIPGGIVPAAGGKLFFYVAGSVSTKQTVYKDNAAAVSWSNPIVLDSGGNLPSGGEVWFPTGQTFKAVLAPFNDTDPPASPYWSKDNLSGINDVSAAASSSSTFIQAGTGAVSTDLQTRERQVFYVTDYAANGVSGAKVDPTGVVDSTLGIQAAINSGYLSGVNFPAGRFLVSSTLTFPTIGSIPYCGPIRGAGGTGIAAVLSGATQAGTVIATSPSFSKPLFKATSSRDLEFCDFSVVGPGKGTASSVAFHFDNGNSNFKLNDIVVSGWQTAFQNGDSGGGGANDDHGTFTRVKVLSTNYVVRTYNTQAYIWNFYSPNIEPSCDTFLQFDLAGNGNKVQIFGGGIGCTSTIFNMANGSGILACNAVHFESGVLVGPTNALIDCGVGSNNATISMNFVACFFNFAGFDYTQSNFWMRLSGAGAFKFDGCSVQHPNPVIQLQGSSLGAGGLGNSPSFKFDDTVWTYEPTIIRPDTGLVPQYVMDDNTFIFYNQLSAQGTTVSKHSGWIPHRVGPPNGTPITQYYSDTLPTGGIYLQGDRIQKFSPASGTNAAWSCVSSGTYGGLSATGSTNGSTATITAVSAMQNFIVGQYVTANFGFASSTLPMRIQTLNGATSTMTLNTNSNAVTTATITQVNPVWKGEAVLS